MPGGSPPSQRGAHGLLHGRLMCHPGVLKLTTSSIDPIPIFLMGEQYRRASHHLVESEQLDDVTMPAAVCAAFALELYFKSLVALDSGQAVRSHDLRVLFDRLETSP